MRVVVGLGNPGPAYVGTRHNVGFAVVAELASRWRLLLGSTRGGLRMVRGIVAGEPIMLVEPQLYMNRSGVAVASALPELGAPALIVIHDDLDLELGCVRVKRGGGTGGHRGLESMVESCGADFTRVRVGIGRPPMGGDPAEYVLATFQADEASVARPAIERAADAVECVLREGEETAMNNFNVRTRRASAAAAPAGRK